MQIIFKIGEIKNKSMSPHIINMHSRCERVDNARLVFDRMPMKSLVSWNAMILGHCIHGNPKDGLNLYVKIVD